MSIRFLFYCWICAGLGVQNTCVGTWNFEDIPDLRLRGLARCSPSPRQRPGCPPGSQNPRSSSPSSSCSAQWFNPPCVPPVPRLNLAHTLQTAGYDGSMMNGLNILPSYTDYFVLNPATTGLNTASIFIGGFFGPLVSGIFADRLGRRPAIFWGSVITLVGVLLQTAAQDIAMFVIARIVLGFGAALSGIAGGVYLSETFPSQWRAWGVGMLNNFY